MNLMLFHLPAAWQPSTLLLFLAVVVSVIFILRKPAGKNKDPMLSFEEFAGEPGSLGKRDNFGMFFTNNIMGDFSRNGTPAYKKCLEAHPKEFGKLAEVLSRRDDHYSQDYLELLYLAYRIMRRYAETDDELMVDPNRFQKPTKSA